jgi:hypothetical protein
MNTEQNKKIVENKSRIIEKNLKNPEKQSAFKKFLEKLDKAFKETCST